MQYRACWIGPAWVFSFLHLRSCSFTALLANWRHRSMDSLVVVPPECISGNICILAGIVHPCWLVAVPLLLAACGMLPTISGLLWSLVCKTRKLLKHLCQAGCIRWCAVPLKDSWFQATWFTWSALVSAWFLPFRGCFCLFWALWLQFQHWRSSNFQPRHYPLSVLERIPAPSQDLTTFLRCEIWASGASPDPHLECANILTLNLFACFSWEKDWLNLITTSPHLVPRCYSPPDPPTTAQHTYHVPSCACPSGSVPSKECRAPPFEEDVHF